MIGKLVLHYLIKEPLGAGGMGEVYRAEDTRLGRQVALKFLPSSYQYDIDRSERFLKEARAASALRSPNVASIYDIGEFEGSRFIVMEYVEGELLSRIIARGPLPVPKAIDVVMQVADALDEAHNIGIIHRDIKSSNMIVTERGLVKVLDFGLAKMVGEKGLNLSGMSKPDSDPTFRLGQETVAGMVMGTVSYMSPEQALGRAVDRRSDIFSLGIVLYEMLAAKLPFEGESPTEIIDKIVHREPPAIARFNYGVPQELERIIRKSIEKNPGFRYQTAREIHIDLHNLLRDLDSGRNTGEIEARQSADHQPTAMLSESDRYSGMLAAATRLENAVAVLNFTNITKEAADDWIGSGIAETVTADLKNIHGVSVIGRERMFEVLRSLGSRNLNDSDDSFAISLGRRLAASWIIGGGYQRIGEMIRITARFVDVGTGSLLKSVKIDGKISEIFDLQDRIVYELSKGLNLQLGTSEINEIERDETHSVDAYEHFSRGMMNLRTGSRDTLDRAIYHFEKAVEYDPGYARAWAALGVAFDLKGSFLSIPELSEKAIEFEKKAIELNPRLSQAHQWLGGAYNSAGRFEEAVESIKEAINLEPNNAGAHAALARVYWLGLGRIDEGITELEHAIALNPQGGYAYLQLALLYTLRGRYDRAETVARRAIELQERYISGKEGLQIVGAHTRLGYVFYSQGRYDEALKEYEQELDFLMSSDHALRDRTLIELDQKIGAAYHRKGRAEDAERHFRRAVKKYEERVTKGADDPYTKYYMACLFALDGDKDRALKLLEESFGQLRKINTIRAQIDPDLESLRDDPRFIELIEQ
ncbi:MAG TPA: protein kinase [Blastocatellia bacterium]|nr:protein kinase [Blastocatellia bacterium]